MRSITTNNLAEVLYLVDRGSRISKAAIRKTWPYGVEELHVTVEGPRVEGDHELYTHHGGCCRRLSDFSRAFDGVMDAILRQEEEAILDGHGGEA